MYRKYTENNYSYLSIKTACVLVCTKHSLNYLRGFLFHNPETISWIPALQQCLILQGLYTGPSRPCGHTCTCPVTWGTPKGTKTHSRRGCNVFLSNAPMGLHITPDKRLASACLFPTKMFSVHGARNCTAHPQVVRHLPFHLIYSDGS